MSQSPDRAVTILARFNAAQNSLAAKLRDLPAHVAEEREDIDTWTAAQIGWHVATANDWFAGILIGTTPMAEPAPPNFRETLHTHTLPDKIKTSPALEPPQFVGRDSAMEKLRASGQHMSKAIASLTPERGSGYTVTLSYGTLSLFELADFAAGHIARHIAQIDRAVARA
jgi:DinB family protein